MHIHSGVALWESVHDNQNTIYNISLQTDNNKRVPTITCSFSNHQQLLQHDSNHYHIQVSTSWAGLERQTNALYFPIRYNNQSLTHLHLQNTFVMENKKSIMYTFDDVPTKDQHSILYLCMPQNNILWKSLLARIFPEFKNKRFLTYMIKDYKEYLNN